VNGLVLGPGEYRVESSQDAGRSGFAQAGVIRAIAHGEVETTAEPARYSVVLIRPTAGGANAITEMQFQGKRSVSVLTPSGVADPERRLQWWSHPEECTSAMKLNWVQRIR